MQIFKKRFLYIAHATLAASLVSTSAHALKVDGIMKAWPANQHSLSIKATNDTNQPKFYLVKLVKAEHVFTHEQDKPISMADMAHSLFASPTHLAILPHHSKIVTLVFPNGRHNKKEVYYRVFFKPVAGTKKNGFFVMQDQTKPAVATSVHLETEIGVAVIVPPVHPHYATQLTKKDDDLTIVNKGNAFIRASLYARCVEKQGKTLTGCFGKDGEKYYRISYKVFPHHSHKYDLRQLTHVQLTLTEGGKKTVKHYK